MKITQHIKSFLEYCEVAKNQSEKTIENYSHYLKRFENFLITNKTPDLTPNKIDLKLINKYRLYLNRHPSSISTKTQNYHIIALRAFLKYLTKNDIPTLAPEKIELPKTEQRTVEVLNKEELESLFKSPNPKTLQGARDLAILETLYSTGLRVSELQSLDRDQINLKRKEFMVRGKGKKPRIVFLSEKAAEIIEDYLKMRKDNEQPLFISIPRVKKIAVGNKQALLDILKVNRLSTVSIQKLVSSHARKAGIVKKVTPHTLRHSFATELLINGADIRSVQELLGHASITTTQIYTHVTNKALREIHQKFHK